MKIFSTILLIIILIFAISTLYNLLRTYEVEEVVIEIEKGETAGSISNKLFKEGVISNKNLFYLFVKLNRSATRLSYGNYLFHGKLSILKIHKKLVSGEVILHKITIPEGLSLRKTINLLSNLNLGDQEVFSKLVYDAEFSKKLTGMELVSLEGFLYPETYFFPDEADEKFILSHIVKHYFQVTAHLNFRPIYNLDYYQIIIMASIVEREAKFVSEQPIIASVYLNRIEHKMKLQADPTVAYILEEMGRKRKKIYYRDLEIDSPYNTYKNNGLPPTPICSPSIRALEAVLDPAETDYFFFFAGDEGKHIFSQTYSQHLSKQRELKK